MNALIDSNKPLVAAVHGARSRRHHHADALRLRLRGRGTKFQMPLSILLSCGIRIELLRAGRGSVMSVRRS